MTWDCPTCGQHHTAQQWILTPPPKHCHGCGALAVEAVAPPPPAIPPEAPGHVLGFPLKKEPVAEDPEPEPEEPDEPEPDIEPEPVPVPDEEDEEEVIRKERVQRAEKRRETKPKPKPRKKKR